jgi:hypothetical protein
VRPLRAAAALTFAAAGAFAAGCAANLTSPVVTPTQSPSGSPSSYPSSLPSSLPSPTVSATPQACGPARNASLYVAMSFGIAPVGSQYGLLFAYAAVNSDGTVPVYAAPISASTGQTLQFVNLDGYDPSSITLRSAAGFPGATQFPGIPYTFPASAYSPALTTITNAATWSTGLLQPSPVTDPPCYSQLFTLATAGTFYFGDVLYYNDYIASPRGVIVVTAGAGPRKGPALRRFAR